jgi:hypothetical protein
MSLGLDRLLLLSLVDGQAFRVRFYQKLFVNEPLDFEKKSP